MIRRKEVGELIERVLDQATFTMRQVAELAGVTYTTVRRWKTRTRVPDADSRRRLASAFRKHAARLQELARELEESVGEDREG